jgi:hypothetical protein
MMATRAVNPKRFKMLLGAISLMPRKAEFRETRGRSPRMIRSRVTLAMMLAAAIESEMPSPLTMASCGSGKPGTGSPSIRQWSAAGEGLQRAPHRQVGGTQDVEAVDFPQSAVATAQMNGRVAGEFGIERLPPGGADFFESSRPGIGKAARQDDRRGGHRAGQWPTARLIHSRDPLQAAGVKGGFEGQVGHGQKRVKRSRWLEGELFTVENNWVAKTMPSESTTTPMPVWVQESVMFLWWSREPFHKPTSIEGAWLDEVCWQAATFSLTFSIL